MITSCSSQEWETFQKTSPQRTIFTDRVFLESYQQPVTYLKYAKGAEMIAGFVGIASEHQIQPVPFQAYGGILFKDLTALNLYHRQQLVFTVLEAFAQYVFDTFETACFSNHWDIQDMRPFDWLHYHERDQGYFEIKPYYTSLLDIANLNPKQYARLRNRDLNRGLESHSLTTKPSTDVALLDSLHNQNFERQGKSLSVELRNHVKNVTTALLSAHKGVLLATYVDTEPAALSLFGLDDLRAYHIFVGTDDRFRDLGVGTKNLHDACGYLHNTVGLDQLDLVGVNSPQRGGYKLSFGGELVPYFQVNKIPSQK